MLKQNKETKIDLYGAAMHRMMSGKYLTDNCDFLRDMIIHHEIALIMSREIYQYTQNPRIMEFTRNIIYGQELEIAQMRQMMESLIGPDIAKVVMNFVQLPSFAMDCKQFHLDKMWGNLGSPKTPSSLFI